VAQNTSDNYVTPCSTHIFYPSAVNMAEQTQSGYQIYK